MQRKLMGVPSTFGGHCVRKHFEEDVRKVWEVSSTLKRKLGATDEGKRRNNE